ncbi:MAG: AsmA family protein [Planctomycetota bacterium]
MKKLVKLLLALVVVVVLVAVLAVIGVVFYIDSIAKAAIQRGGTYATGVPTTVDSVHIGLFTGELTMEKFDIANPSGFSRPSFFSMGDADVAVSVGSLFSDMVEVPYIRLDAVGMTLLRNGDGEFNYQVILDNLAKLSTSDGSGDAPPPDAEDQGGSTRYIVNEITITNINAVAEALGQEVEVVIPEIKLTDVGSDTENGVLLSQLQGVIIKAIMEAIVKKGIEIPDLQSALAGGLAKVPDITALGDTQIDGLTQKADELVKSLGGDENTQKMVEDAGAKLKEATGDAGKKAEDALKEATQGLGGLLGGGDKKDEDKE